MTVEGYSGHLILLPLNPAHPPFCHFGCPSRAN
jgi:hypothetical protein